SRRAGGRRRRGRRVQIGIGRLDDGVVAVGRIADLYFEGDREASVANTGQVSSRITDLRPVADIVRRMWCDIDAVRDQARVRRG
ncbi:MAG TPA: hypothetical protein VEX40_18035, partial [Mycobacterium sp.]|nr:hypothetical protein [Mycobacterium sp.]